MMTTISIGKDIQLILTTETVPTHENQWKKIQSFDRLSNILCGKLGSYLVADLVAAMFNTIPTGMEMFWKAHTQRLNILMKKGIVWHHFQRQKRSAWNI